jgi:heme/copper-type cytochrome/quinol oxidase subunit 2
MFHSTPIKALALVLPLVFAGSGCISVGAVETGEISDIGDTTSLGFGDDRDSIQVITTLIGGKNVFIPSTIVVTAGRTQTLAVHNTTDSHHGFRIPALGVEILLEANQETIVNFPALVGGNIYGIDCHLHAPHRHATLMVVHGN